jgi:GNAT superfamily N-acetyltransferase
VSGNVPIVDLLLERSVEAITGYELDLVALALRQERDLKPEVVSIMALKSYMPVGALKWDLCDGEITDVWVRPSWRRHKVATVMLRVAEALAEENGWEAPRHSTIRTLEGDAWALALGAEPAGEIATEGDYSRAERPGAEASFREALSDLAPQVAPRRPRLRFYPRGQEPDLPAVVPVPVIEQRPKSGTGQTFTVDALPPAEPPKRPGVV